MGKKKEKQQLAITGSDEIINTLSLEEIYLLLGVAQTTRAEEIYLEMEERELNNLLGD